MGWLCCSSIVWEPIRETSSNATHQRRLRHSRLSSLSHHGLILASWSGTGVRKHPLHTHSHTYTHTQDEGGEINHEKPSPKSSQARKKPLSSDCVTKTTVIHWNGGAACSRQLSEVIQWACGQFVGQFDHQKYWRGVCINILYFPLCMLYMGKKSETVDCQHSEKRSKMHKKLNRILF